MYLRHVHCRINLHYLTWVTWLDFRYGVQYYLCALALEILPGTQQKGENEKKKRKEKQKDPWFGEQQQNLNHYWIPANFSAAPNRAFHLIGWIWLSDWPRLGLGAVFWHLVGFLELDWVNTECSGIWIQSIVQYRYMTMSNRDRMLFTKYSVVI